MSHCASMLHPAIKEYALALLSLHNIIALAVGCSRNHSSCGCLGSLVRTLDSR